MRSRTLLLLCLVPAMLPAQAPPSFQYQAIARNAQGDPLVTQAVGVSIGLRQYSANGNVVYAEAHAPVTDPRGLFTLAIGTGTVGSGQFDQIAWGDGPFFLEVGLDPTGGTAYAVVGTQQLLSVPYALHARDAWSLSGNAGTDSSAFLGTKDGQPLRLRINDVPYGAFGFGGIGINGSNLALGVNAMENLGTGAGNLAIGNNALRNNSTGYANTALGHGALATNQIGTHNVAIGTGALANTEATGNTAIGVQALDSNLIGSANVAVGRYALRLADARRNTALGNQAAELHKGGEKNVAIGHRADHRNAQGANNTVIGAEAGGDSSTETNRSGSVFLGHRAGYFEPASNKLYIDNTDTMAPLIHGDFLSDSLAVNGSLSIAGAYTLPTVPGASGQVLHTYGDGTTAWAAPANATLIDADGDGWPSTLDHDDGDAAIQVHPWVPIALDPGWITTGTAPAYYRAPDGTVRITGQIRPTTTGLAFQPFQLPVGYRPAATAQFTCAANDGSVYMVQVLPGGGVNVFRPIGLSNASGFGLDALQFRAAP